MRLLPKGCRPESQDQSSRQGEKVGDETTPRRLCNEARHGRLLTLEDPGLSQYEMAVVASRNVIFHTLAIRLSQPSRRVGSQFLRGRTHAGLQAGGRLRRLRR